MNYATGYALTTKDLFKSFDIGRLKLTAQECKKILGNRHKERIVYDVFKYAVKLVLDDVIHNNVTFSLPTGAKTCTLGMKRFRGQEFQSARRAGKWRDVDFLASNFTAYQMNLNLMSGGITRDKLVYLDTQNKDSITSYTNEGKQYY